MQTIQQVDAMLDMIAFFSKYNTASKTTATTTRQADSIRKQYQANFGVR